MPEKILYYKHDGEWEKLNKSPSITVGSVEHLNSDSAPYVHNVGTDQNIIFNFGIPKGEAAVTAINPRGDYDNEAVYERNDYVTGPDGNSYVWKAEESGQGHPPTTGHKDDPYWQLFVIKGSTGDRGATFIPELSDDGILSWSNDSDFDNPAPRKISTSIKIGKVESVDSDVQATITNTGTEHNAVFDFQIPKGESATVNVGTITTIEPNSEATVVNSGTTSNAILNFSIPRGERGHSATITIGNVSSVSPDELPAVTNKGTTNDAILDFSIPQGLPGKSTSIEIGNVTTSTAGSDVTVTNTGTKDEVILDFSIPRGEDGVSPTIRIGEVTQVSPSTQATVTNVGNNTNVILNFQIPKGEKGEKGSDGRDAVAAINPRGIYDDSATYERNDYITGLDGNSYVCSVESMTGIAPPHENWQLLALKGADGKSFTFDDLTDEQKEELKGEKGQSGEMVLAYGAYDYENMILEDVTSFSEGSYKCREAVASNSGLCVVGITQSAGSSDYIYLYVNGRVVMLVPVRSGSVATDVCVPVAKGDRITAKTRIEPTKSIILIYPYKIDHVFTDKISSLSVAVGEHGPDVVPSVINKGTPTNPELEFNLKDGEVYITEGGLDVHNWTDYTSLVKSSTTTNGSTTLYVRTLICPESGLLTIGFNTTSAGYWYANINERRLFLMYSRSGTNQNCIRVSKGDEVVWCINVSPTGHYAHIIPFNKSKIFTEKISSLEVKIAEHNEDAIPQVVNTGTPQDPVLEFTLKDGKKGDKGDTGNSAYEDAVAQGFEGTLEEWLYSLRVNDGLTEIDLSEFILRQEVTDYNSLLTNNLTEIDLNALTETFMVRDEVDDYRAALLGNLVEVDLSPIFSNFLQKGEILDYKDAITNALVEVDLSMFQLRADFEEQIAIRDNKIEKLEADVAELKELVASLIEKN